MKSSAKIVFLLYLFICVSKSSAQELHLTPKMECYSSLTEAVGGYTLGVIDDNLFYVHTGHLLAKYPLNSEINEETVCGKDIPKFIKSKPELSILQFIKADKSIYCIVVKTEQNTRSSLYSYLVDPVNLKLGDPQLIFDSEGELADLSQVLKKKKVKFTVNYTVSASSDGKLFFYRELSAELSKKSKIKHLARFDYHVYDSKLIKLWNHKKIINTEKSFYTYAPNVTKGGAIYVLQNFYNENNVERYVVKISEKGEEVFASGVFENGNIRPAYLWYQDEQFPIYALAYNNDGKQLDFQVYHIEGGRIEASKKYSVSDLSQFNKLKLGKGDINIESVVATKEGFALGLLQRNYMQNGYMDLWNAYSVFLDKNLQVISIKQIPLNVKGTLHVGDWIHPVFHFNPKTDQFLIVFNDNLFNVDVREKYLKGSNSKFPNKDNDKFRVENFCLNAVLISEDGTCQQKVILNYKDSPEYKDALFNPRYSFLYSKDEVQAITIPGLYNFASLFVTVEWDQLIE